MSKMINFARKQVGKPYVFMASGPKGFDCSGLGEFQRRLQLHVFQVPWLGEELGTTASGRFFDWRK